MTASKFANPYRRLPPLGILKDSKRMKRNEFLTMGVHVFGAMFMQHIKSMQVCKTVEPSFRVL